jgi:hypothetical protein
MNHQQRHLLADRISVPRYFGFAAAILAVVFAWLEPIGASELGFLRGFLFWSIQMGILIPLLIMLQKLIASSTRWENPWVGTFAAGALGAMIFSPVAYLLDVLFGVPEPSSTLGVIPEVLDEFGTIAPPIIVVWLGLNAPWILKLSFHDELKQVVVESSLASPPTCTAPFLDLVAREVGGDILSISSELHYVRVRTSTGSGMLLYNLRDAIRDLAGIAGTQIHRSHWVAQKHIARVEHKNGQKVCVLTDGTQLPISRRRQQEVLAFIEACGENPGIGQTGPLRKTLSTASQL